MSYSYCLLTSEGGKRQYAYVPEGYVNPQARLQTNDGKIWKIKEVLTHRVSDVEAHAGNLCLDESNLKV